MEWRHETAGIGAIGRLLFLFRCVVAIAFAILAAAFWLLQIERHSQYLERAGNNHQRQRLLRAPRGVVFDRDGRVMVQDRDALNLSLVPEQVEDVDRTLRLLARLTGVERAGLRAAFDRRRGEPPHRPVVVIRDASRAQVAAVVARRVELPGVVVEPTSIRSYPAATMAAHSFGYVGEVSAAQLAAETGAGLRRGHIVGQSGVELSYNRLLMGVDGARHVVVDSTEREIDTVGEVPPVAGQQLRLTIDADVQAATEAAFHVAGFDGAAVMLDPHTGEVLALVSLPAYDPNTFARGIDGATLDALTRNRLRPLHNRALQGRYPPGSTFKAVMAVAALEEEAITPAFRVRCDGGGRYYGRHYRCHARHGVVDLEEALEKSCNTYFYALGARLDIDQIHRWATALGLGQRSGVDLPYEVQGLVPSRAWKRERHAEPWYPGETISVAIGQGRLAVTPMSLAVMMSSLVNGGRRITPRVLQAFQDGSGWKPAPPGPPARPVGVRPESLAAVRRGLWRAVNGAGTGGRGRIPGRDVLGKTGTAQVISRAGRSNAEAAEPALRDHGWFVFAAPAGDPQIAGVVFAEHSDHGYLAAPIARHALETFFAKRDGRPLPDLPAPADPAPAIPAPARPPLPDLPVAAAMSPAPAPRPAAPAIADSLVGGGG